MRTGFLFAAVVWTVAAFGDAATPMVVHEWGTITTLHAADGTPQGHLNRIATTEVLPDFVHRFEPATTRQDVTRSLGKSPAVPGRPDVTMRLETPVMYFYPSGPMSTPLDVWVHFRGGVLNEFYPTARPNITLDIKRIQSDREDGAIPSTWSGDVLNNYVMSSLKWQGVRLTEDVKPPATSSAIWLAPRAVRASGVATAQGESERYLFYRGVAHLDALLQTRLDTTGLHLLGPLHVGDWLGDDTATIARVWFVSVHKDGILAYRERGALTISKDGVGTELLRLKRFDPQDFNGTNLERLRASMKRELVAQGLFEDEAQAMLETWKVSYFEKPGMRVFYIVPTEWTGYFLPLDLSVPATVTRVLVGRIDLQE